MSTDAAGFGRTLLKSWAVPARPYAVLEAWYVGESRSVVVTVTQSAVSVPVAMLAGDRVQFPAGSSGWRPSGDGAFPESVRSLDDPGMLAFLALCHSGDYCKSQALTDASKHSRDPLWRAVAASLDGMLAAASVILD